MSSGRSAAERAYDDYLDRLERGEQLDFEAFCAEHRELEGELRTLHAFVQRVAAASPGGSLSQRLAERYGSQADPQVTLKGSDEEEERAGASGFSSEVLGRLAERTSSFGRYVLKGEIDRGGQGAVVRVWDEDLRRALAMKVLLGKGTPAVSGATPPVEARSLGRFLEEAQVTGQLDHPGIVPVHELGLDAEGRVYFTMKLVKGRTLKDVLELVAKGEEGWSQTRALGVLSRVCEAMAYAHHKGVVHRDLKPANVMVGRFGEVYVMDWGLAKVLGRADTKNVAIVPQATTEELRSERRERGSSSPDSPLLTMDGDVVGTPAYMPPEQALGRTEEIGPHSDVYALGAMLYHLIAGHMPYLEPGMRLSNYDIWYLVQKGPPTPVLQRAPGTPAELVAICERAMAREIEKRYPDMRALAADLAAYLEHRVVAAYETGALAEAKKWVQRNKPLAASLAAALLLLVAGLATSLVFKARADENARLAARRAEETAEQARIARDNERRALTGENEARRQERIAQENAERAEQNAASALQAQREAEARTADVLSLSAQKDLDDLVARAERLWPPHPELLLEYERWLREAQELLDGRPASDGRKARPGLAEHRAKLAEMVGRSEPATDEAALAVAREHASYSALQAARAERTWLLRMLEREPWPDPAEAEAALEREDLPADREELLALAQSLVGPDFPDPSQAMRGWSLAARALDGVAESSLARALLTLAWAEMRIGRIEEALVTLESALELDASSELSGEANELRTALARWQGAARAERENDLRTLSSRIPALELEVGERRFTDPEDRWWQVQLSKLVADLEALADPERGLMRDVLVEPFGWGVEKRHTFARTIAERSVNSPEAQRLWSEAIAAIATSAKYGGLVLSPQMGLLPIGPDPESSLWEFAHLMTGDPPQRDADGKLVLTEEMGIVLVLIPGGKFWMGAQKDDPNGRNFDPDARSHESPVHEVELSPYFLSKYEMTQGQWQRMSGRNPSTYGPDRYFKNWNRTGLGWSSLHPVEQLSWIDCMAMMERVGLSLPSEAQWERGARGGTSSVYWTGDDLASLAGAANLSDQYSKTHGNEAWPVWEKDFDDGSTVHARVGSYRASGFGLHDVHGNVWEWCVDGYSSSAYRGTRSKDPVVPWLGSALCVARGGSFGIAASGARSACRHDGSPGLRFYDLGLRPSRGITP